MAKSKRIKAAAVEHFVPQTQDQVVEAIARIGEAERVRVRIEADMNDALAALRQQYEERAKPYADRVKELTKGVQLYCEAHRTQLTNDGKIKTHAFASGEVRWRMDPPSVTVRGADVVLAALKGAGLDRFVRVHEEVNKEAILADPESVASIKGITISQRENFVVVPWETGLEQTP